MISSNKYFSFLIPKHKLLYVIVIFFAYNAPIYSQSEATKYPPWVYNPTELKGMVSAIANATGSSFSEANQNAKYAAKNELYVLIQYAILEITTHSDSIFIKKKWVDNFPYSLSKGLTEKLQNTSTREVYLEKTDVGYRAIVLIDYPLKEIKKYIKNQIDTNNLLAQQLKQEKVYKGLMKRISVIEKYIRTANIRKQENSSQ
jgi:hypothetical protein